MGDTPHLEKLIGPVKVLLDAYAAGKIHAVYLGYTRFINTMKQEPTMEQLLPLSGEVLGAPEGNWDYIYEPDAKVVLEQVLTRYIEALIYQAVAENMASEQSARMVAMKAASDNAVALPRTSRMSAPWRRTSAVKCCSGNPGRSSCNCQV